MFLGLDLFEDIFDAWKTPRSGPGVCSMPVSAGKSLDDASSPLITVSSHLVTLLCSSSVGVEFRDAWFVGGYRRDHCRRYSNAERSDKWS